MNKLLTLIGLIIVILALYMYLGYYNISATQPHISFVEDMIQGIKYNSVKHHTEDLIKPPISKEEVMKSGFEHYDAMCVHCHGAPGIEESGLQNGLYPKPPSFPDEIDERLGIEQIYWITKKGIKMSGMPGFGAKHSDEQLWLIAGFVKELENISPEKYAELQKTITDKNHNHNHDHSNENNNQQEVRPADGG